MITLGEWLRRAAAALREAGVDSPELEASVLAAHELGRPRAWVLAHPEVPSPGDALLARRLAREPLAYLLGTREFYGRDFEVGPAVLIPRQETEVLLELALAACPAGARVLDVGTGSGCIAVTLALERPDLSVAAGDLSPEALAVAQRNADRHHARVEFHRADLVPKGLAPDVVVSNPPYVAADAKLQPELAHEPAMALFAEEGGMAIYRRLLAECPSPVLLLEVGDAMAEPLVASARVVGWSLRELRPDLAGTPRAAWFVR